MATEPKATEPKTARVMLTSGSNGSRAVAWIAGKPQGFTQQYVFPPLQWLEVAEADAAAIQAGKAELGGRTFDVTVATAAAVAGKPAEGPSGSWAPVLSDAAAGEGSKPEASATPTATTTVTTTGGRQA